MKFAIEIGFNEHLVIDVSHAGPLLEALKTAVIVTEKCEAGKTLYVPSASRTNDNPGTLRILLLPDEAFVAPDDAKKVLVEENKVATQRWLEYYTKYTEAQKKITELEAQIDSIKNCANTL